MRAHEERRLRAHEERRLRAHEERRLRAHEDVEDLNFADKRVDGHVPQVEAIGKKKALGR